MPEKVVPRIGMLLRTASKDPADLSQSARAWKSEVSPTVSPVMGLATAERTRIPSGPPTVAAISIEGAGDLDEILHLSIQNVGLQGAGRSVEHQLKVELLVAQHHGRASVGRVVVVRGDLGRGTGGL